MSVTIRKATGADEPALSNICLLTADAGKSAKDLHDFAELPGLIFAVPYVKLPNTWGFVMEDELSHEVVGYVLGTTDTRYFEQYAEQHWWPPLAEKYSALGATKPADVKYINTIKHMFTAPQASVAISPAHLHINILEPYQRAGWGRKLIDVALGYLKDEGFEAVWVGLDQRNDDARAFYYRLGFRTIEGTEGNYLGKRFWDFK